VIIATVSGITPAPQANRRSTPSSVNTSDWVGDRLTEICAIWTAALQERQLGLT
jgi:hypothetical protein